MERVLARFLTLCVLASFLTLFWQFPPKEAPRADELLNRCKETIQKISDQYLTWSTEDDGTEVYLMNRHQCRFLIERLKSTRGSLDKIQLAPRLDEKTTSVLDELHQVLLDVERVINASRITSSQWPRAAIEQCDMKETFASLLYGVQWHASVLLSILVDNSRESSITLEPSMCGGELSLEDEHSLLIAMKEDGQSLKDRLSSVELDHPIKKGLADQLLKMLNGSHQLDTASPDMLYIDPQNIKPGILVGRGAFGEVRKMNLLDGKYAVKIFDLLQEGLFPEEVKALQGLGHHPHIVHLMCYSHRKKSCYLIMEEMEKDLQSALRSRAVSGLTHKRSLSDERDVTLMLQIGEGMKFIHSKRMAHRDLKSGNVLVNLAADPSSGSYPRICSVKIADFGHTKTQKASRTYSSQTLNTGTNNYMAPEVIGFASDPRKSRLNPRKCDVYSFAIICSEILTGEDPYCDTVLRGEELKKQVKAGLRPSLPKDCPPKLADLIRRCWHLNPQKRPLFPEICRELRYIKGLLLKGDHGKLELQTIRPTTQEMLDGGQVQGPWGGKGGIKFHDVGPSINRIKLRYSQFPGLVGAMEVEYTGLDGHSFVKRYCHDINGDQHVEMVFEEGFEFITHISGYVTHIEIGETPTLTKAGYLSPIGLVKTGKKRLGTFIQVGSLTIHTNIKSYGPFGKEEGEKFTSGTGRVVAFHGGGGAVLDSLGVEIILDGTS